MTPNELVSVPVPAVVGTATSGRAGSANVGRYSRSRPRSGLTAATTMPLAASIEEPPPTATTAGRAPAAASAATVSAPAATSPVVGLACTPLNTVTGMPAAASTSATLATTAVPARPRSVTMTAAWQPVPRTTPATASTAPAPKYAGGMGSSTSLVPATGGPATGGPATPAVLAGGPGSRSGLRAAS